MKTRLLSLSLVAAILGCSTGPKRPPAPVKVFKAPNQPDTRVYSIQEKQIVRVDGGHTEPISLQETGPRFDTRPGPIVKPTTQPPVKPPPVVPPPPVVKPPVKPPPRGTFDITTYDPLAGVVEESLPNGLKVVYKVDKSLPMVSTAIGYRVGGVHESEGVTGLAHFLEHMMFNGTDKFDKHGIDAATFRAAGTNNAFTSEDNTVYYFRVASENLEDILQIESNRMTKCALEEKMFETEKQNVMEELNRMLDGPWGKVFQERDRIMFTRHPYHHPVLGWREDLVKMTREQMANFYKNYYAPNNAVLVIVGDYDLEKTRGRVKELFGPLSRAKDAPEVTEQEPWQNEQKRLNYDTDYEGDRIAIGFKTVPMGAAEDYVLDVISTLLTGSRTARLNKRLVETEGLVSEGAVSASHESRRYIGVFSVTVEPQLEAKPERIEEIVLEELAKLAAQPVEEKELRKAKNITQSHFVYGSEGQLNMAIQIANIESMGVKNYLREYLRRIEEVTPKQIQEVAGKFLAKQKSTVILAARKSGGKKDGGGGGGGNPKRRAHRRVAQAPVLQADPELGEVVEARLPNGLKVMLKHREGAPVVSIRLWINASGVWEPEDKAGVAYMTGELMDEGTDDFTTGETMDHEQISETVEALGASLGTGSGGIGMKGLAHHRPILLSLLKKLVIYPSFPEARLKMVQEAMLDDIAHRKDDPVTVAGDLFREAVYKGHPRHRPEVGYESTVKRLTRRDVTAHYKKLYRPDNAILVIVGEIDPNSLLLEVRKHMIEWDKESDTQLPALPPPPERAKALHTENRDIRQCNVYMGNLSLARENPDYYVARVAEVILCSSPVFSDRLSKAVRVEEGLAYSVGGSITGGADLWPGTFSVYVGTRAAMKDKTVGIIQRELKKYIDEGPTPEELGEAKNYLVKSFFAAWDSTDDVAGYLLGIKRWNLGLDYHKTFRQKIMAVTREDVQRVAKEMIDLDRMTVSIVGPVDKDGKVTEKEEK
jgi:zinc protease